MTDRAGASNKKSRCVIVVAVIVFVIIVVRGRVGAVSEEKR
jgi:t-SNARE complex subunit (syntaxin)